MASLDVRNQSQKSYLRGLSFQYLQEGLSTRLRGTEPIFSKIAQSTTENFPMWLYMGLYSITNLLKVLDSFKIQSLLVQHFLISFSQLVPS